MLVKKNARLYRLLCLFSLFQKNVKLKQTTGTRAKEEPPEFKHIRCPLCRWKPKKSSRWQCNSCAHPENFFAGCRTIWNTFTTRGLCPGCGHQWRWTSCPSCHNWSLHEAWYEEESKK